MKGSQFFDVVDSRNTIYVDINGSDTEESQGGINSPVRTIEYAISLITNPSETNPYLIKIGVGEFTENEIVLPENVSMEGASILDTIILPAGNHHICTPSMGCEISFISFWDAPANYAAINCTDAGAFVQLHKVSFTNCDIGIQVIANTTACETYLEYVDFNGIYTNAIKAVGSSGISSTINIDTGYTFPTSDNIDPEVVIDGDSVIMEITGSNIRGNAHNNCMHITNGASLRVVGTFFQYGVNGVYADAVGVGSNVSMVGTSFDNCTTNLNIANETTTGSFTGFSPYNQNIINPLCSFFINSKNPHIITVGAKGSDYTSISDACNSITDSSIDNPYIVLVSPGVYIEPEIIVPTYVSVCGTAIQAVEVHPDASDHNVFTLNTCCEISFLSIRNAGSGYAGVSSIDTGDYTQCHKVSFYDCDIGMYAKSITTETICYGEYADFNGTYTHALHCVATGGNVCRLHCENVYLFAEVCSTSQVLAEGSSGSLSHLTMVGGNIEGNRSDTGVESRNGAAVGLSSISFHRCGTAIYTANYGLAPNISALNCTIFRSADYDIFIQHPDTVGFFSGFATYTKVSADPSSTMTMNINGNTVGLTILKDLYQGSRMDQLINFSKLVRSTSMMGLISGGVISVQSGRTLSITGGSGFVLDSVDAYVKELSWVTGTVAVTANSEGYIYISNAGVISSSSSQPDMTQNILLGRAYADTSSIDFITNAPVYATQYGNINENMLRSTFGSIFVSGCLVSEGQFIVTSDVTTQSIQHYIQTIDSVPYDYTSDATPTAAEVVAGLTSLINADGACPTTASGTTTLILTPKVLGTAFTHSESANLTAVNNFLKLNVTDGSYYYGTSLISPTGGSNVPFEIYWRNGSGGYSSTTNQTTIDTTKYDNGSGTLATMTSSYYAKHSLYVVSQGSDQKYFLVISQAQYDTFVAAQEAGIPVPPTWLQRSVVLISTLIVKNGTANYNEIRDTRPRLGFTSSAVTSITSHGDLQNLNVDDHKQYLLVDGARAMTGALNMGSQAITSVGQVDGVTVSAHASRHLPNGADPLTTAAASGLSSTTTNAEGSANSLARSDHTHAISTATASGLTPDQTSSAGTSSSLAKADHIHNIPAGTPSVSLSMSSTNSKGTAASFALSDHSHAIDFPNENPLSRIILFDDFLGGGTSSVHQLGWQTSTSGTGAAQAGNIAAESNAFGVTSLTTGTTGTGRVSISLAGSHFSQGLIDYTWRIRIPTLSNGTQTFTLYVGFGNTLAVTATNIVNGVYFTYTNSVNSGNWVLNTSNNSSRSTSNTAVAATTGYVKLRIVVAADGGSAEFFIDGTSVGTITSATTIPITTARQCGPILKMEKSAGATGSLVYADLFMATVNFTTSR